MKNLLFHLKAVKTGIGIHKTEVEPERKLFESWRQSWSQNK
jgi:hypothetical protein